MTLAEEIFEHVKTMPPNLAEEIFDFVKFIEQRKLTGGKSPGIEQPWPQPFSIPGWDTQQSLRREDLYGDNGR